MSFETNIRSFAHAASVNDKYNKRIVLLQDGIEIVLELDGKSLARRVTWYDLALSRVPWGTAFIDDMKYRLDSLVKP